MRLPYRQRDSWCKARGKKRDKRKGETLKGSVREYVWSTLLSEAPGKHNTLYIMWLYWCLCYLFHTSSSTIISITTHSSTCFDIHIFDLPSSPSSCILISFLHIGVIVLVPFMSLCFHPLTFITWYQCYPSIIWTTNCPWIMIVVANWSRKQGLCSGLRWIGTQSLCRTHTRVV